MKQLALAFLLFLITMTFLVPASTAATPIEKVRVIVFISPNRSVEHAKETLVEYGDEVFTINELRAVVLRIPRTALKAVQRLPFVVHVEEDGQVFVQKPQPRTRVRFVSYTTNITVYPGDAATVSFTLRNNGQNTATVAVEVWGPDGAFVNRTGNITIPPRARYTDSISFRTPRTPGTYTYTLVVVDAYTGLVCDAVSVEVVVTEPIPPPPPPPPSADTVPWNVELVKAPQAWNLSSLYGDAAYGALVQVAVVDTGIDYMHYDLYEAIAWCVNTLYGTVYTGYNFTKCADGHGHGTAVTGVIAARINNWGIVGVAPKTTIYVVKALYDEGYGYYSEIALGIIEAVKGPDGVVGTADDADVISMSFGGGPSTVLYEALKYAYNNGVVLVAGAGNSGASTPAYPAAYPEVIAVGAIDRYYVVPSWSNRNPDVVAPGVSVLTTQVGNRHASASGTSFSCPHVSAAIALAQAVRTAAGLPRLSPSRVIELVRATAVDQGAPGYDELFGYGVLDTYALVLAFLSS